MVMLYIQPMKKILPLFLSLVWLTAVSGMSAFADSPGRLIEYTIEDNGSVVPQIAKIHDGNVSVQRAGGDPNLDLLFDSAEMTLFIIDHRNKSYYKIDQNVINKAASMIQSLSAVAESQEGVLSDLLGTLGLSKENEQANIDIVKTDTVLSTAGINCQLFQQLNNGKLQSELCIAPESGLGVLGEHYQTMALFYQFGDSLMSKAGNILQNIGFGLPNLSRLGQGGLPIMAYVVEDKLKVSVFNIQTDNPAKTLFELPQGYIQTPIPFIG